LLNASTWLFNCTTLSTSGLEVVWPKAFDAEVKKITHAATDNETLFIRAHSLVFRCHVNGKE
jgi:hypothetical protein